MAKVTDSQWAVYRNIINGIAESFNKEVIRWGTRPFKKSMFGESVENTYNYTDLECLIGFNTFRTWPITNHTESGELDNQNMLVLLNKQYLSDNGWLTTDGYFHFDPAMDEFIHRGIRYKCDGDTFASQAKDDPLHIYLILVRQEIETGGQRDEQP